MPSIPWILKNCAILALVALLYALYAGFYPGISLVTVPILFAQTLVLLGGCTELLHYLILRRNNASIADPVHLETRRGLYSLVRHPMYFGDLAIIVGLTLLVGNLEAIACACLGIFAIARQARIEDRQLIEQFGEDAVQWHARSRAVVPYLW